MTDQDLPEGAFWEEQLQPVPQHPLQPEQPPLRALRSWLLTMRINTTSTSNATMAVEKFISYRSFCRFFQKMPRQTKNQMLSAAFLPDAAGALRR